MKRILVIGSGGQIGSELVPFLRKKYGKENVIATGRRTVLPEVITEGGPWVYLDALNQESLKRVIYENSIDHIFHMASVLSATGEKMPQTAW
ncbi:MAG: NAD-dependent epimerase/dehydratase family protein, partial [Candidatus Heimdallarchaeota archaeon]